MKKKELQDYLNMEMSKLLCELEIKIHQRRKDNLKTKIARYFNSTPLRNVFARYSTYSYIVNKFYTITYVTNELRATRQTVSTMVEECENEGWIEVKRTPNRVEFKGTFLMYKGFLAYLFFRKELTKNITKSRWNDLTRLDDLVENDFTLYEQLNDKSGSIDTGS